jgi:hypothetical protein
MSPASYECFGFWRIAVDRKTKAGFRKSDRYRIPPADSGTLFYVDFQQSLALILLQRRQLRD